MMGNTSRSNRKRINDGTILCEADCPSNHFNFKLPELRKQAEARKPERALALSVFSLGATYHSSKTGSMADRRNRSGSAEEGK
jgi:hypothetical protein